MIICLCGSTKYPLAHLTQMAKETLKGNIVLPMGVYGHADFPKGAKELTSDSDHNAPCKQMLDKLHLQKIDMCDEVVIVVHNEYVGDGTVSDIEYAKKQGKSVRMAYSTDDSLRRGIL